MRTSFAETSNDDDEAEADSSLLVSHRHRHEPVSLHTWAKPWLRVLPRPRINSPSARPGNCSPLWLALFALGSLLILVVVLMFVALDRCSSAAAATTATPTSPLDHRPTNPLTPQSTSIPTKTHAPQQHSIAARARTLSYSHILRCMDERCGYSDTRTE